MPNRYDPSLHRKHKVKFTIERCDGSLTQHVAKVYSSTRRSFHAKTAEMARYLPVIYDNVKKVTQIYAKPDGTSIPYSEVIL